MLASWSATSCAVGGGATVGVHYTTDRTFRVQLEIPLEVALVGAGTDVTEASRPYMRAAVVPALSYDPDDRTLRGGIRAVAGPVFQVGNTWLGPAFTAGASTHDGTAAGDFGVTMDVELPRSVGSTCDDVRFTNPFARASVVWRVTDSQAPFSARGGMWDLGLAGGVRRTWIVSCGGGGSVAGP